MRCKQICAIIEHQIRDMRRQVTMLNRVSKKELAVKLYAQGLRVEKIAEILKTDAAG